MNYDDLLKSCKIFQCKSASLNETDIEKALNDMAIHPEQSKMLAKELSDMGEGLQSPSLSDKQDISILLRRAAKALSNNDIKSFLAAAKTLDILVRKFKPEDFDPELTDFILDEDVWSWIFALPNKSKLDKNDLIFIPILRDNLLYLASK
jgi:hypothetical protein